MSILNKKRILAMCGVLTLTACGADTTSGPVLAPAPIGASYSGLPVELQACGAGLYAPGCDKNAAGAKLAEMANAPDVLRAFREPRIGTITMRATADGMRYGTDPVSCGDITALPEAFDGAVYPGAAPELQTFIHTMSQSLYQKKGCS